LLAELIIPDPDKSDKRSRLPDIDNAGSFRSPRL
jgi:hypothetical protein